MPTKRDATTLTEFRKKVIMYVLCINNTISAVGGALLSARRLDVDKKPQKKTKNDKREALSSKRVRGDREKVEAAAGRGVSFLFLSIKAPKRGVIANYSPLLILS